MLRDPTRPLSVVLVLVLVLVRRLSSSSSCACACACACALRSSALRAPALLSFMPEWGS